VPMWFAGTKTDYSVAPTPTGSFLRDTNYCVSGVKDAASRHALSLLNSSGRLPAAFVEPGLRFHTKAISSLFLGEKTERP